MLEVREATEADAKAVADVHVRAWREGYRGLIDQDFLDGLVPAQWVNRYAFGAMDVAGPYTLVAVEGDQVCGLVTLGRSRDADLPQAGEVWAIYVDPSRWGSGVGGALLSAASQRLRDFGHDGAFLWVLSTNWRARRFYEGVGWRLDGRQRTIDIGGIPLGEVSYRTELNASGRDV